MSKLSSVPIEPEEQTRLLDACSALPGVIGGGVPGGTFAHFTRITLFSPFTQPPNDPLPVILPEGPGFLCSY